MENEKRLIDANALKRTIRMESWKQETQIQLALDYIDIIIDEQPKVDAVEVVHGKWEKVYTCHGERLWAYSCDLCKAENGKKSNYCPNCGAKMDGD